MGKFMAIFADYTHPRKGTEVFKHINIFVIRAIILIPARGRKYMEGGGAAATGMIILIPARGRKLYYQDGVNVHKRLYSSPQGDGKLYK